MLQLPELVQILQGSVTPVVLISGVGLLILSMTNRLGRVVDRSRQLCKARRNPDDADFHHAEAQLQILTRRARLLRRAILFAVMGDLLAATLVIVLFCSIYLGLETVGLISSLFVICLGMVIAALVAFYQDINLSLAALDKELDDPQAD